MKFFEAWHHFGDLAALALLAAIGGCLYGACVWGIFGRTWLRRFRISPRD